MKVLRGVEDRAALLADRDPEEARNILDPVLTDSSRQAFPSGLRRNVARIVSPDAAFGVRRDMATAAATYEPRATERGVLHSVVREHLETFLAESARAGREGVRLPEFVEQEFRDFLTCGVLAHGFARVRCDTCAFERLVPFSCKGRGFCPSCGGRRMTERAARLVTEALPRRPVLVEGGSWRALLPVQRERARVAQPPTYRERPLCRLASLLRRPHPDRRV